MGLVYELGAREQVRKGTRKGKNLRALPISERTTRFSQSVSPHCSCEARE